MATRSVPVSPPPSVLSLALYSYNRSPILLSSNDPCGESAIAFINHRQSARTSTPLGLDSLYIGFITENYYWPSSKFNDQLFNYSAAKGRANKVNFLFGSSRGNAFSCRDLRLFFTRIEITNRSKHSFLNWINFVKFLQENTDLRKKNSTQDSYLQDVYIFFDPVRPN